MLATIRNIHVRLVSDFFLGCRLYNTAPDKLQGIWGLTNDHSDDHGLSFFLAIKYFSSYASTMEMIMAEVYGGTGLGTPRCVCPAGAIVLQCSATVV